MFGGQRARRKFGGPEMYKVAKMALTAGLPGKRTAKSFEIYVGAPSFAIALTALSDLTRSHFYFMSVPTVYNIAPCLNTCSSSSIS
jgi:hypothetical protein